jgi:predicted amidohydrolase YtcJ
MIRRRWAVALATLLVFSPAPAATLVVGANGYTVDDAGRIQRFSGLLIADDGRVKQLLGRRDAEPRLGPGDYRLDAAGRTLIPGLVDAHVRLMALGLIGDEDPVAAAREWPGLGPALRQAAAGLPQGGWRLARGWRPDRWTGPWPTAAMIDTIIADRPVLLLAADDRAAVANGAALQAAGITRTTADPPGGRMGRDGAGNPDGRLQGTAVALVPAPAPGWGARETAFASALSRLAAAGVTTVHDIGTAGADWALYRTFADDGRLSLRIAAYADGVAAMEAIAPLRPTPWLYGDRLALRGIAFRADGTRATATAWTSGGGHGWRLLDDARMKNLFSRANYLGYQIAVEARGDAALAQTADALAEIFPAYGGRLRNRVEGADMADAALLERLARLDVLVTREAGDAAADDTSRGSFAPEGSAPGLPALAGVVGRLVAAGRDRREATAAAFAGFTHDAARAAHMEDRVGSLAPGHWADFVLLDRDPFTDAAGFSAPTVVETFVAGRRIFQRR